MVYRELHVREIGIPNIKGIGRGLVPRSETIDQIVTGAAEGQMHGYGPIRSPAGVLDAVAGSGGGGENQRCDCGAKKSKIHGGYSAMCVKG